MPIPCRRPAPRFGRARPAPRREPTPPAGGDRPDMDAQPAAAQLPGEDPRGRRPPPSPRWDRAARRRARRPRGAGHREAHRRKPAMITAAPAFTPGLRGRPARGLRGRPARGLPGTHSAALHPCPRGRPRGRPGASSDIGASTSMSGGAPGVTVAHRGTAPGEPARPPARDRVGRAGRSGTSGEVCEQPPARRHGRCAPRPPSSPASRCRCRSRRARIPPARLCAAGRSARCPGPARNVAACVAGDECTQHPGRPRRPAAAPSAPADSGSRIACDDSGSSATAADSVTARY